jgi:hypothetical protein
MPARWIYANNHGENEDLANSCVKGQEAMQSSFLAIRTLSAIRSPTLACKFSEW